MRKTSRLGDVARLAGVSTATVSRVVNRHKNVANETRKKVEDAIQKLDYNPHAIARNLATGKTGNILLYIVHEDPVAHTTWSYELPVVQGICDCMNEEPLDLQINICSNKEFRRPGFLSERLKRQFVDGILILGSWKVERHIVSEIEEHQIPYVLIGCRDTDKKSLSIETDNESIIRRLVGDLASAGHQIFGLVGGDPMQLHMQDRESGFRLGLEDKGLPLWSNLVKNGDWTVESGYYHMKQLLSSKHRPTAVICGNDYIAVGAIRAIRDFGARVPEDIAVTGFDDTRVARIVIPNLTTVKMPLYELGTIAADRLKIRLAENGLPEGRILLAAELVVRDST